MLVTVTKPQRLKLEYEIFGEGQKLLFIHGGGTDYHFYQGFIDKLAENFCVHTFSLPGFGKSEGLNKYTTLGLTTLIDEFVLEVHLDSFILAGHSLGGGLALAYAALHQSKISKLLLLAPQIYPNRKGVFEMMSALAQNARLESNHNHNDERKRVNYYLRRLTHIKTTLSSLALLRYVTQTDNSAFLERIDIPVLGVIGAKDLVIPPDEQRKGLSQLKNIKLIEYPDNGHNALFSHAGDIIRELTTL